jgi:P27 family predicted phage terminase small subunit
MNTTTKSKRPKPPEHLENEALLEWERIVGELEAAGKLDTTDRAILTVYAETWAAFQAAAKHVAEHGAVIRHQNQLPMRNPFFTVQKETGAQLRALLNDLGLTPASRKAANAEGDDSELDLS